jgi:hypothetical protein
MLISSDLIPHDQFHKGAWLRAASGWYYFFEYEQTYKIPTDSSFYDTIDPQILPIIKFLHSKEIPTTPSCEGHFYDEKHYKRLYNKLQKETYLIRIKGLTIKNESFKCKYGNRHYTLPWTESEFIKKVLIYQTTGVLGFKDDNRKYYDILQFTKERNITTTHDHNTTLIITNSGNKEDMITNWKVVESLLKNVIGL